MVCVGSLARQLYVDSPAVFFWMQRLRPYICPFDRLVTILEDVEELLDVGCGAGLLLGLWACAGTARRGVGFDLSRPAIEAANKMKPRANRLGSQADLTFLCIAPGNPWPEGQFEAVTLIDVMHHVPTAVQRSFFTLACEKVKAGGRLVYTDISDRRFLYAAMNRVHDLVIAREWSRYVPLATVEQWAVEGGLQVVSMRVVEDALVRPRLGYLPPLAVTLQETGTAPPNHFLPPVSLHTVSAEAYDGIRALWTVKRASSCWLPIGPQSCSTQPPW